MKAGLFAGPEDFGLSSSPGRRARNGSGKGAGNDAKISEISPREGVFLIGFGQLVVPHAGRIAGVQGKDGRFHLVKPKG